MPTRSLIAVDIGNSRTKLGWFDEPIGATGLPKPAATLDLRGARTEGAALDRWLARIPEPRQWVVASVTRPGTERLKHLQSAHDPSGDFSLVTHVHLDLTVKLPAPKRVGIDRLLGAVAANRLRSPKRAAIVIDVGTAITIDLVSETGAFLGGAILPGIALSARALHEHTDQLPLIPMTELNETVPPLGRSTVKAMSSGLYWGAVGAMRELIERLGRDFPQRPDVFLTGGAAPSVGKFMGHPKYVPHLVLAGVALVAREK